MTIQEMFQKCEDSDFNKEERKPSDLIAFILLNNLVPDKYRMVAAAEHDEIYLGVSIGELEAAKITEDQVKELVRCGVLYNPRTESLYMFV